METAWREICAASADDGIWPDIIFFYGAHLGHYSGVPYVQALLAETMVLLDELGFV